MKTKLLAWSPVTLTSIAIVALAGCSSTSTPPPGQDTSVALYEAGVPGGVLVNTRTVTAKVTAIDADKRKVTLINSDGSRTTVKCGPEVINFDQIRVGDSVKVKVVEELVAYLADVNAAPQSGVASMVALAPKGVKPGGVMADTIQVTAKVSAIDLKKHKATLQFPDGSTRTVAVRRDVDLTKRHVGEEVVIRITEVVALNVAKKS